MPPITLDRFPFSSHARLRLRSFLISYKAPIAAIVNFVKALLPPGVFDALEKLMGALDDRLGPTYADELRGIANATGLPLGDIVIMNLYYELDSGCTSILAQNKEGQILHGRNLDSGVPGLQNITIDVSMQKSGKEVYRLVTYAGYVGALTGMRAGHFRCADVGGGRWRASGTMTVEKMPA